MAWTTEIRVRVATDQEARSRTLRSGSTGQWLVERKWRRFGDGQWEVISAHLDQATAEKALMKLARKIAKEAAK